MTRSVGRFGRSERLRSGSRSGGSGAITADGWVVRVRGELDG